MKQDLSKKKNNPDYMKGFEGTLSVISYFLQLDAVRYLLDPSFDFRRREMLQLHNNKVPSQQGSESQDFLQWARQIIVLRNARNRCAWIGSNCYVISTLQR